MGSRAHDPTPSAAINITAAANGKLAVLRLIGCKRNCVTTGASTTSGRSVANISTFRTCESAMCSSNSDSRMRGGESLMPQ